VLLEDQDRSRWNQAKITEGTRLVAESLQGGRPGRYAVQAAIAALHAQAPSARETDWAQIASLYAVLARLQSSPVVELNRAVAIAMSEGLEKGLALIESITLPGYHLLPAARADLLRRLGRAAESAAAYREALSLVTNEAERRFLERRLAEVS
jgi:RNA polymerase sigma-70 factor (ECF subfamily)